MRFAAPDKLVHGKPAVAWPMRAGVVAGQQCGIVEFRKGKRRYLSGSAGGLRLSLQAAAQATEQQQKESMVSTHSKFLKQCIPKRYKNKKPASTEYGENCK